MQHVLGVGAIGSLLAAQLSRSSTYPVRLIVQNRDFYHALSQKDICIEREGLRTYAKGLQTELLPASRQIEDSQIEHPHITENRLDQERRKDASLQSFGPISSLFVTTKAQAVLPALRLLQPRLSRDSTVVLLQNGAGLVETLVHNLFPDENIRPNFVVGVNSHGAWVRDWGKKGEGIHTVWAGVGEIAFGVVPNLAVLQAIQSSFPQPEYNPLFNTGILKTPDISHLPQSKAAESLRMAVSSLLACNALNPNWLPLPTLLFTQLQKVAVNCVINPLTAIFNVHNGAIRDNEHIERIAYQVCAEASRVFAEQMGRTLSPDASHATEAAERDMAYIMARGAFPPGHPLHTESLLHRAMQVAQMTSKNNSSTLQDVRSRKSTTEIDFMNGYVSSLGREYGIATPVNDTLADMVHFKTRPRGRDKATQQDDGNEREEKL